MLNSEGIQISGIKYSFDLSFQNRKLQNLLQRIVFKTNVLLKDASQDEWESCKKNSGGDED